MGKRGGAAWIAAVAVLVGPASRRPIAARAHVLAVLGAGGQAEVQEYDAVEANWNQALSDATAAPFVGELRFSEGEPCGCGAAFGQGHRGIVLVDLAATCGEPALVAKCLAEESAVGVVFIQDGPGLNGVSLGDHEEPAIRAVAVAGRHGEALRRAGLQGGNLTSPAVVELRQGRLIATSAYEEQFIMRADELQATRAINFLWHTYPEFLKSSVHMPLSSLVTEAHGFKIPDGWFSSKPSFVPLFNPSLVALEDGSFLVTLRLSNGPGCPSVRSLRESSMETRIFRNELLLVHADIDAQGIHVRSQCLVRMPPLSCVYTGSTKTGGRKFLDEVHGPMDARIARSAGGETWLSFYAERNHPDSNDEVVRGIHAAPLHVEWQPCAHDGSGTNDEGRDGGSATADGVRFGTELGPTSAPSPRPPSWQRARKGCPWLSLGNGRGLRQCQRSCVEVEGCNAVLFSRRHSACALQNCRGGGGAAERPVLPDWEAWHRAAVPSAGAAQPNGLRCLGSAWVEPTELVSFPVENGVEKNWNLMVVGHDHLFIEYHIEPHIVLGAKLSRTAAGIDMTWLATISVTRWPYDVLHGVSNVRGGYCCLELPEGASARFPSRSGESGEDGHSVAPGGRLLLGCGHLQRIRTPFDQAPGDVDRFRRQARSRTYFQFFYVIRGAEPFDVLAVSSEWCVTINGQFSAGWLKELSDPAEACEAIQFAGGLALHGQDELVVAYGINDCEADILVLPLDRVLSMLRPVRSTLNVSLEDLEMI